MCEPAPNKSKIDFSVFEKSVILLHVYDNKLNFFIFENSPSKI